MRPTLSLTIGRFHLEWVRGSILHIAVPRLREWCWTDTDGWVSNTYP